MPSENVERVLNGYAAFNRRDIEAALDGISPDVVWRGPDVLPEGEREFLGHEGVKDFWRMWLETFEEFHAEIEETIESGDQVMAMVRMHGRHRDSGAEVVTPSFPHVWTIQDEEVVRVEMYPNRAAGLDAIGMSEEQVK
jgi:ketosteroid isomerase-like protein